MTASASPAGTKQPNSRHCFACGLENPHGLQLAFYETGPAEVSAGYTVPERYQGYPGRAHGGIVAAMLDEVTSRAAMIGTPTRFMVTAKLTVAYRHPVPLGVPLRLVGWLTRRRGRVALARGELRLADGTVAADAEAMLAELGGSPGDPTELEALGWKVYPDDARPGETAG